MAIKKLLSSSPVQKGAPCKVGSLWRSWWRWRPPGAPFPPRLRPRPPAPPEAPPPGPTSRASHLLPECTVVTVVGLGLRSAPTPETPDEEEMKLQSVEGARPAGDSGHKGSKLQKAILASLPPARICWQLGSNFYALDSKLLLTHS